ncbi:MAG: cobyrinate a,c-diamide synthase [Dissulfurimicrobium sp.]|uniref:cobyrinate a,c-diamide synthase n=1 Tax=Dissulfurimicrobium sp. TaxID=2022436 RepID=UPI003D10B46F
MSKSCPPRLVISAIRGGSGKTVLTLGLIRLWREQGFKIAAFKKGPDYIDAGWMALANGSNCYNLDPFLMSHDVIKRSFLTRVCGADIGLIEGNRGLFDGSDSQSSGSTAGLAKVLRAPVILTLDCTKMTRTAAAVCLGCKAFDPDLDLAGVVLNQVAQRRHESVLKRAIEEEAGVKVFGALPRLKKDPLPMRHLGVTPCEEYPEAEQALDGLGQLVKDHVDTQGLMEAARDAGDMAGCDVEGLDAPLFRKTRSQGLRIGVFRDAAFQFYYPENLEAIECAGVELVFLNAINDKSIPEIDALYIGGGFPETQARALSANKEMLSELKRRIEQGLPVYAECGGLMYLGAAIVWKGERYPMAGVFGWDFVVHERPVGHGYSTIEVMRENPFYKRTEVIKGHEFHYSKPVIADPGTSGAFTCKVIRGYGFDGASDGICYKNCFGTYTHVHALWQKGWAEGLINAAKRFHKGVFKE